jgi:signal transduction histidine kinase
MVGSLIGIILLLVFILFLFQGKKMITRYLKQSSESVTREFSVFVLDAMIKDANGLGSIENVLGHYMLEFIEKNPKIIAMEVFDGEGNTIAANGPRLIEELHYESYANWEEPLPDTFIQKNQENRWIATVFHPMRTGSLKWGTLIIHFHADREHHEITNMFWLMLSLMVLLIVAVIALLSVLLTQVTRSLGLLKKEMDRFDPESEDYLTPIKSQDEIGAIFNHFNELKRRLLQSRQDFLKAQKQVYHAEKLASIGRFASGMAHEINNPLNGIQSCLYSIKREPENIQQTMEYLELATEGLNHIEMVVRKLLGFARKQSPGMAPVNLLKEAQTVLGLLDFKLNREHIEFVIKESGEVPAITGDAHLIQELIMNLVLNSFDAVVEKQEQSLEPYEARIDLSLGISGEDVLLRIRDNGPGIPEEHIEHLFDPFFTTKEQGKGTGLGLSVAMGIAQAHGGSISVRSLHLKVNESAGSNPLQSFTEFAIKLPLGENRENSIS